MTNTELFNILNSASTVGLLMAIGVGVLAILIKQNIQASNKKNPREKTSN